MVGNGVPGGTKPGKMFTYKARAAPNHGALEYDPGQPKNDRFQPTIVNKKSSPADFGSVLRFREMVKSGYFRKIQVGEIL